MKEKEYQKYLNQKSWYHGTTLEGLKGIKEKGVMANYNRGNELDFGYGFYLTPTYKQAESYVKRNLPYFRVNNIGDKKGVIIQFELCLKDLMDKYNHASFLHFDKDFAEFVIKNRLYPKERKHNYDFILGVMSDSNPYILIADYRNKIITYEDLVIGLQKWNSMEQLSLHNQNLCDILKIKEITYLNDREENA